MDPHFSVLVGEDKGQCGNKITKDSTLNMVAIVVPVGVVVAIVIGVVGTAVAYPKYFNDNLRRGMLLIIF